MREVSEKINPKKGTVECVARNFERAGRDIWIRRQTIRRSIGESSQSLSSSLMPVFERVFSSTRFTMTAQ